MEGDGKDQELSTLSGTATTQVDTQTQNCSQESDEPRNPQHSTADDRDDSEACDGVTDPMQETLIPTNSNDNAERLSQSTLPTQEEVTPPSLSSHPSDTQDRPSDPCWYCMRSLKSEYHPETSKQEDLNPTSPLPSSGPKVSYQTDPRPHFGVAWSSHSTCRPLWGSEGPCWGQRNQEVSSQMHTCPHCHLSLPPDTLRWHEAKCLLFEGLRNSNK